MRLRYWLACLLLALGACRDQRWVDPIEPVRPPPPYVPTPPDNPPPTPGQGAITEAEFDAMAEGMTVDALVAGLGQPYQKHNAAGFVIYTYVIVGTTNTAFFWIKDGILDHKGRAP